MLLFNVGMFFVLRMWKQLYTEVRINVYVYSHGGGYGINARWMITHDVFIYLPLQLFAQFYAHAPLGQPIAIMTAILFFYRCRWRSCINSYCCSITPSRPISQATSLSWRPFSSDSASNSKPQTQTRHHSLKTSPCAGPFVVPQSIQSTQCSSVRGSRHQLSPKTWSSPWICWSSSWTWSS